MAWPGTLPKAPLAQRPYAFPRSGLVAAKMTVMHGFRCACHFLVAEECDAATFVQPLLRVLHHCLSANRDHTVLLGFSPGELRGFGHGLGLALPAPGAPPEMLTALIAAEVLRRGEPPQNYEYDPDPSEWPENLREHAIDCMNRALDRINAELAGMLTPSEASVPS